MTVSYKDRIYVTSASTGTGTLTQGSALTGYAAPSASDDGKTFVITIVTVDSSGVPTGQWEITESVYTHSGATWSRGTLYASSTGSRINFSAGTKRIAVDFSARDAAKIGSYIDLANAASSGSGTQADPWIIDSVVPVANTTYRARTGYYSYSTSPAWAVHALQLIGESGVYFQHTGRGVGFDLNNTNILSTGFVGDVKIHNINVLGRYATGTGTVTVTSGSANVVGVGTAFTTQLAVGDAISVNAGTSSVETHKVATITNDTHLTVEENWVDSVGSAAFTYGTTTDAFKCVGLGQFSIEDCSARDQGSYALNIQHCTFGEIHKFDYSIDNPSYHQWYHIKGNGIILDTDGSYPTTEIQIFSPSIDTFRNYGIYFKTGSNNQIFGGSCESTASPATALRIDGDGSYCYGVDCEGIANGYDFYLNGVCNGLINCTGSGGLGTSITSNSYDNQIIGGQYKTITNAGFMTNFLSVTCNLAGGSGITDNGTQTALIGARSQNTTLATKFSAAYAGVVIANNVNPLSASSGDTFAFSVGVGGIAFSNPTNATAGQTIRINIISSGNGAITWDTQFRACNGVTLPTASGAGGTIKYVSMTRDYSNSFWDVWQAN